MRRFFVEPSAIVGEQVTITGELVRHLGLVLRLTPGTQVLLCCGDGREYLTELTAFQKEQVAGKVLALGDQQQETTVEVVLYQGMPKGDKLELIIQKCTELGVSRIVPMATKRAVVKLEGGKAQKKQERWQKIAQEASQQAKRVLVPEVSVLTSWRDALQQLTADDLTIVLWEEEAGLGLKQVLQQRIQQTVQQSQLPARINLIIGPEGGLEETEVNQLKACGAVSATLGKRILRTETAGLAALTMVLYELGDLG